MSHGNALTISEKKLNNRPEDSGYDSSKINIIDGHLQGLINKKRIQAAGYLIAKSNNIIGIRYSF